MKTITLLLAATAGILAIASCTAYVDPNVGASSTTTTTTDPYAGSTTRQTTTTRY